MILILLGIKYLVFFILAYAIFRLLGNLITGDPAISPVFRKRGWGNIKWTPLLVFAAVLIYQVNILYFEKPGLLGKIIQQEDKRSWSRDRYFERGKILDRNGVILAESDLESELLRNYPHAEETVHILGYFMPERKERAGLERIFNESLSGDLASGFTLFNPVRLAKNFGSLHTKGNDLNLSIDMELQKIAYDGLAGRKGAAVGIDPETGDILFLVSSPGYDPQGMYKEENWSRIQEQEALLNRAINGLYEPGSTFKVIIAAAALENGLARYREDCPPGGFKPKGAYREVTDHNNIFHGEIGLERAVMKSCNVYFAQLGIELTEEVVKEYAEKFLFNTEIQMKGSREILRPKQSFFPPLENIDENALAWSSIGQFQLQITPLHMAVVAAIIANDGVFVEPKIEKNIGRGDRERIIARDTAVSLRKMMYDVVGDPNKDLHGPPTFKAREERFGTGWPAKVQGLPVAGKTGTAENPHGDPHAWFMGFAPVENPKIAFAFVVENGGYGGDVSGPIAKMVLQKAVELGYFGGRND